MPLDKNHENVVSNKKKTKHEVNKLTVLKENDKNTIYNLIFAEQDKKSKENSK